MPSSLLSLPYDIRHLIYQHLLPKGEQIYIQVSRKNLQVILPDDKIPVHALLACRALHHELAELLYNDYLFNLVGTKTDCLAAYKPFLRTLRKHAREEININAFSNGEHSSTMCLSLQAGDAKMKILNRRRRGEPKTIGELEEEQMLLQRPAPAASSLSTMLIICALVGILLAFELMPKYHGLQDHRP